MTSQVKTIYRAVILMALFFSVSVMSARAQDMLKVTSVEAEAGSEVTVQLLATSSVSLSGISFKLAFDKDALEIKSVVNGSEATAFAQVGTDVDGANTNGLLEISMVDFSFANPVAVGSDQEVFKVTFAVSADADGEYPLMLTSVDASDPSANNVPLSAEDGLITVVSGTTPVEPGLSASLRLESETATSGGQTVLTVMADTEADLSGVELTLSFDTDALEITSVDNGADASSMTQVGTDIPEANSSGELKVSLVDFSFSNPVPAGSEREVLKITFSVASDAEGEYPVSFLSAEGSDPAANTVSIDTEDGVITIENQEIPPVETPTATLRLNNATANQGENFQLAITVNASADLNDASFKLSFNPEIFKINQVSKGSNAAGLQLGNVDLDAASNSGQLDVSLVGRTGSVGANAARQILLIEFSVMEDAPVGEYTIEIGDAVLVDTQGNQFELTDTQDATVGVSESGSGGEQPLTGNVIVSRRAQVTSGTSGTFQLALKNETAVAGISFDVSFDNSLVTLTSVKVSGDASGMTLVGLNLDDANSGSFAVSMVDFSFSNPISVGLGTILEIGYEAIGDGELEFTISNQSLSDQSSGDIPARVTYLDAQVTTRNKAPVWNMSEEVLNLTQGEMFSYQFQLPTDPDGDNVSVRVSQQIVTGALDLSTLQFNWTPGENAPERFQFLMIAEDSKGSIATKKIILNIAKANRAPVFISFPDARSKGRAGVPLNYAFVLRDPDGDATRLYVNDLPEGAVLFNSVLKWDNPVAGTYDITVWGKDSRGDSTSFNLNLDIESVNLPPEFVEMEAISTEVGQQVQFQVEATDRNGDQLTYLVASTGENSILNRGAAFQGNTFTWTPTDRDVGPNRVPFVVIDGQGGKDVMGVMVVVQGRNIDAPPQFGELGEVTVNEGELFELQLPLSSGERERVRFWAANWPDGSTLDERTGLFRYRPGFTDAGRYEIVLGVNDGRFQDIKNLVINVEDVNLPPELMDLPESIEVSEGELLRFKIFARDGGGDELEFSASGLPERAVFHDGGLITYEPGYNEAGTYPLEITVTDPVGNSDTKNTVLTVVDVNRPPEMVVTNQSMEVGETMNYTVTVSDPDDDDMVMSADTDVMEGSSFDPATGLFSVTATAEMVGNHEITFKASDGTNETTVVMMISVGDVNHPPQIDPVTDVLMAEGDTVKVEINVSDDSAGELNIALSGAPDWVDLEFAPIEGSEAVGISGGEVTLTCKPHFKAQGLHEFDLIVTDSDPDDPRQSKVHIKCEVKNTDQWPRFKNLVGNLDSLTIEYNVMERDSLYIDISAADAGGDSVQLSTVGLPPNAYSVIDHGDGYIVFKPSYGQAGAYRFTAHASDGASTKTMVILVNVENVNRRPRVFDLAKQSVDEGGIITFMIDASDPDADSVIIHTLGDRMPFLTGGDNPPAYIRDGNVFVFDTQLLPTDRQIESAVFLFWASDPEGAASDTVRVEVAVIRKGSANFTNVTDGSQEQFNPQGLGISGLFRNNSGGSTPFQVQYSEESGFPDNTQFLADEEFLVSLAGAKEKSIDEVPVYTALLAGTEESGFYSIRRGWGLDLTSDTPVEGTELDLTLNYLDEDLPTEVPNFNEGRLMVFGFDQNQETWVPVEGETIDTVANMASFQVTDYAITEYTVGSLVDVVAPLITNLEVSAGGSVSDGGVDTVYSAAESLDFKVNVTDDEIISSTGVKLYYSIDGGEFTELSLSIESGNLYTASLEAAIESESSVTYYIEASDGENIVTLPAGAPDETYSLVVIEASQTPGDVNGGGTVDIFDLLDLLGILGGGSTTAGSDVNGDGATDIFDLLELLTRLAN